MSTNLNDKKQKGVADGRGSKTNSKQSAKLTWSSINKQGQEDEIDESEQCVICANKIEYAAISQCNHTTCHKCTFRQRALYKKNACLICRTESDRVIITEDIHKSFTDFSQGDFKVLNDEFGINFTSAAAAKITLTLLDMVCPVRQCDLHKEGTKLKNFKLLNEHVKAKHEKYFCEICASNKKAFISELRLYNQRDLQKHKSKGDEKGFKGHPMCQFCSGKRFYSDDELFVHLREVHEKCHVCDKIDPSSPQYFKNYETLSQHFKDQHYICTVQSCLDQKFVVFMDEFDLKAHMLKEHKNIFGGDKNLLSIGSIGYNNTQRNGFGSQLSTFPQQNGNSYRNANNAIRLNNKTNKPHEQDIDEDVDSFELKRMRLEERARHYLNYHSSSVDEFKKVNKQYEDYKIEGKDLLKSYEKIFSKTPKSDIAILTYELSQLFKLNSNRRKQLVDISEELNSETLRDEQFPALPGSSRTHNFLYGSWNNNINASSSTSSLRNQEAFPALPTPELAPKLSQHKVISYKKTIPSATSLASKPKPTPVINRSSSSSISNIKQSYLSGTTSAAKPAAKPAALNDLSFPLLPKVQVKKTFRLPPTPVTNKGVWGASSSTTSVETIEPISNGNASTNNNTGKKKKNKREVLFHIGI